MSRGGKRLFRTLMKAVAIRNQEVVYGPNLRYRDGTRSPKKYRKTTGFEPPNLQGEFPL